MTCPSCPRRAHPSTALALLAAALVLALAGACRGTTKAEEEDPSLIRIGAAVTLRTDVVGEGQWARPTTFILVDATNDSDRELLVTLGGTLLGTGGAEVSALRAESLRIPRGGTRMFALQDADRQARPDAVDAAVVVRSAVVPRHPAPVRIAEGRAYDDDGRAVVAGNVVNGASRAGRAVVFGGFYDADGRPLERPFTVFDLGPGATRPARFVGPEGSHSGSIFVGDAQF